MALSSLERRDLAWGSAWDSAWAEIVDALTRREILTGGAAALALGLGLSACSDATSSAPATQATRKVSSAYGMIEVPVRPKRVVTTDDFSMATMFDLGVNPVGVYSAGEQYVEPQYLSRWKAIAKISAGTVGGAVQVEKVAALHPDLIIGIDASKPPYAELAKIAPTVIMPYSTAATGWMSLASDTAQTINQVSGLDGLKQRYAAAAARISKTYADVLARTRWDIIQGGFNAGQFWLYGPGSPIGKIMTDAGARFASGSASVTNANAQATVSYEEISELSSADAIFFYATNGGQPANLGLQLFAQPLFKRLGAVKSGAVFGSVYFLPSSYGDAIAALSAFANALQKLQATR